MRKSNRLLKCFLLVMCVVTIGIGLNRVIVSYAEEEVRQPDYYEGAYQISTKGELRWYIDYVNNTNSNINGTLAKSINIFGVSWDSIGSEENPFRGVFNGNGYKLVGFIGSKGLFGYSNGTIMNLKIEGGNVNFDSEKGVICDENYGQIINCSTAVKVSGNENIAGICGYNRGDIDKCYNTGNISAVNNVAGICAYNDGRITNCYNAGQLCAINNDDNITSYIAGIVVDNHGNISDSINYGEFTTDNSNYRFYGIAQNGSTDNCYSIQDNVDFSTGEITYLLNHKSTENTVWGQKLGKDDYPGFNNYFVDYGYDHCILKYDNKELNDEPVHEYTQDWQFDDYNHYHECTICHEKKDVQGHNIPSFHHNDINSHCGDCTVCKNRFYYGHDWKVGEFKTKPTEDVNGVRYSHCPSCGGTKESEIGLDIELPFLNKVDFYKKEGFFSNKDLCSIGADDKRSGVKEVFYAYVKNDEVIDTNIVDKVNWIKYERDFTYDPIDYSSLYIKVIDHCDNLAILDSNCTVLYGNNNVGDKYYIVRDITSY